MTLARTISFLLLGITAPLAAQTSRSADRAAVRRSIDAGNATYIAAFKRVIRWIASALRASQ